MHTFFFKYFAIQIFFKLLYSKYANSQNSNIDPRAEVPWLASVFQRLGDKSEKFLRNGVIISESSIMILGDLREFSKLELENIIVVVSLDNKDFTIDGYTHYYSVHFIQYTPNSTCSDWFNHGVIHLKSRIELNEYAQIGDLGFSIEDPHVKFGETKKNQIILGGESAAYSKQFRQDEHSRVAGFSQKTKKLIVLKAINYDLATKQNITHFLPEEENECIDYFNLFFHWSTTNENKKNRWLIGAYAKVLPDYKNSILVPPVEWDATFCYNDLYNTTFVVTSAQTKYQQLFLGSARCLRKFACHDPRKLICLDIAKVCNGVSDCEDGQDENEVYCNKTYTPLSAEEIAYDSRKIQETNQSSDSNSFAYIYLSSGGFFLFLLLIAVGGLWYKLRNTKAKLMRLTEQEIRDFKRGKDCVNNKENENLYENIAYNKSLEITSSQLKISNTILGEGEFGTVSKGELTINHGKFEVAIKSVKPNVDIQYVRAIMTEIKIMQYLGQHPHIVGYFGSITKSIKSGIIQVIVEFCQNGSLKDYLFNYRNFYEESFASTPQVTFTLFFNWALQISKGMAFLSQKKVIHSDLAARNILLTQNCICKIADFGLSRQLFNYSNYIKSNQAPLPWRWMPVESLTDMTFSTKSDVWAFGVTLWEIFSLGQIPFPGLSWETTFVNRLNEGLRLQNPQYLPPYLKNVFDKMKCCWEIEPNQRPTFEELEIFFEEILVQCKSQIKFAPILGNTSDNGRGQCTNIYTNA